MPLTFEQAKKHFNPDPDFKPTVGSPEMKEIIKIMVMSGFKDPYASAVQTPKKYTVNDIFAGKHLHNPMNRVSVPVVVKRVSKQEFLTIEANRKYIEEHMRRNKDNNK